MGTPVIWGAGAVVRKEGGNEQNIRDCSKWKNVQITFYKRI